MSVELNHTIVHVKNRWDASRDVGGVLGLPQARAYWPLVEPKLDHAVSLDFMDTESEIQGQHYACPVSEEEFDRILGPCSTTAGSGGPTPPELLNSTTEWKVTTPRRATAIETRREAGLTPRLGAAKSDHATPFGICRHRPR